ncbi:MAG TPA: lactate dehydrogenase [Candidatus Angelobacter sp.]|nr:lactate dehydrogenase [Candidatus Angelobacter sp.]
MKVGIVGAGAVGSACLLSLAMGGVAREIVLVNRNRKRAEGVITDARYGSVLLPAVDLRAGDFDDLNGAALVMITAGVNEKTGGATDRNDPKGRLRLLNTNADIYRQIVPAIVKAAPKAVILVVTDPPDALANVAHQIAPSTPVLSTGTFLDSLRFRFHLARKLEVNPASIDAMVLGEHGTSQVFFWSAVRISGVPLASALGKAGADLERLQQEIEKEVRYANITIIEGTGASVYGIAVVSARIAEMVLRNERSVIPIGSFQQDFGTTLSLPSIVGRSGVEKVLMPDVSSRERELLEKSAKTIRDAAA